MPKIEAEYRRAYRKYDHTIRIFPEVKDVLQKLRANRIKLAIASNIPSDFLREHLQRFGIDRFFQAVTGQYDCREQKPSPEPILVTLRKLNAEPNFSAYVGDMEEDIIAGKEAGVITIAICRERGYQPCWKLRRQKPNFIISSLSDLIPIVLDKQPRRS